MLINVKNDLIIIKWCLILLSLLISNFSNAEDRVTFVAGEVHSVTPNEFKCTRIPIFGRDLEPCTLSFYLNSNGASRLSYIINVPTSPYHLGCVDIYGKYHLLKVSGKKDNFGQIDVPNGCDNFKLDLTWGHRGENTLLFFGSDL